jgi:hypothetical protein
MVKAERDIETDPALKAVSRIFDVMVWNKIIPPCYLAWISNNLLKQIWQLRVVPFEPMACNSRIESNGLVDVEYYDCGFQVAVKGESMGAFKHRPIKQGEHENLHQVIHCLHRSGIDFCKIQIEEKFCGYKVDILGEIEKDKKYIVVELGKLSLIYEESVKELWFGDTEKFIYSLSLKELTIEQPIKNEANDYMLHFVKYYKEHCITNRQLFHCLSSHYAYNCLETRRLAQELRGLPFLTMDGESKS